MKILVTGNNGYIGSVLTEKLVDEGFDVIGLDNNYFEQCNLVKINNFSNQIIKDIRDICLEDVKNIDAIIHLAALSNDPLGELNPNLTEEINYKSTIEFRESIVDSICFNPSSSYLTEGINSSSGYFS